MHSSNATQRRDIMSMFTGDHVETNWKMSASFAVHTVRQHVSSVNTEHLVTNTDSFLVWLWNSWSWQCGQQNGVKLHQQDPGSCSCQSSLSCWLSGSCSVFPPGRLDCFEVACMYMYVCALHSGTSEPDLLAACAVHLIDVAHHWISGKTLKS